MPKTIQLNMPATFLGMKVATFNYIVEIVEQFSNLLFAKNTNLIINFIYKKMQSRLATPVPVC